MKIKRESVKVDNTYNQADSRIDRALMATAILLAFLVLSGFFLKIIFF